MIRGRPTLTAVRDEKELAAAAAGRGVRVNTRIDGPDQAPSRGAGDSALGAAGRRPSPEAPGTPGTQRTGAPPTPGTGRQDLDGDERPCAHCGRPVPQRNAAGRPFRYCRDNDGECQRAASQRPAAAPGVPRAERAGRPGAFEVAERLDQVVETLVEALHDEVSPAGVERQIAGARQGRGRRRGPDRARRT